MRKFLPVPVGVFSSWVLALFGAGLALGMVPQQAMALSHMGVVEREMHNGVAVLHRSVCARDPRPGHMHCHAHVRVQADGRPMPGKVGGSIAGGSMAANALTPNAILPSGYGPADLRSAYRLAVRGVPTTLAAAVDAYGYPNAEADLAVYRAQYGLPPCTVASGCLTVVNQRGGTKAPATDTGWAQEQALDIQMISAMCPNCRILLVQTDDDTTDNLAAGVALAAARGANAISNSYGGPEGGTHGYGPIYHHPGVAITASAGDDGYGAEFPASAPFVIAVGGTKLVRAPNVERGWKETVWTKSGSGCSKVFPKPAWQTDTLCTKRMMNDVAAVASPTTGVAVYGPVGPTNTSGWMVFGGTSVGAPLIAGIYAAAGSHPTGARSLWMRHGFLFDVTAGTDGTCGGTYFCTAQAGYDGPTGNGTPKGKGAF